MSYQTPIQVKAGDKITWLRQSEALHCTVLEVNAKGHAKLQIEGWVGTRWEDIDYSFSMGLMKVRKGELVPIED